LRAFLREKESVAFGQHKGIVVVVVVVSNERDTIRLMMMMDAREILTTKERSREYL